MMLGLALTASSSWPPEVDKSKLVQCNKSVQSSDRSVTISDILNFAMNNADNSIVSDLDKDDDLESFNSEQEGVSPDGSLKESELEDDVPTLGPKLIRISSHTCPSLRVGLRGLCLPHGWFPS